MELDKLNKLCVCDGAWQLQKTPTGTRGVPAGYTEKAASFCSTSGNRLFEGTSPTHLRRTDRKENERVHQHKITFVMRNTSLRVD